MIKFIDEKGAVYLVQAEIKTSNGVNGERSMTGEIYTNDTVIQSIGRGWKIEFEDEFYCITYALPVDDSKQVVVEFDAVHQFFFDFEKSIIYEELNGSHTFDYYLDFIFKNSGYLYRNELQVSAIEKENFGMKNRLDLFKSLINSVGVEYTVSGKVVRIIKEVGTDLSTVVRKGFNLQELRLEHNIGDFITYKRGYGAFFDSEDESKGRLMVEYKSPLADVYGILEGDPIVDERYTIADNLKTRLKSDVDNSYSVSVDLSMEDLLNAGYEQERPQAGDYIMAINEDVGFKEKVRIVSFTTSYGVSGELIDHQITCNSMSMANKQSKSDKYWKADVESNLENAINTASKAYASANGKNTTFTGLFGPDGKDEPKATKVGDIWYKPNGEETEMYRWDGQAWQLVISTKDNKAIEKKIKELETITDQAQKDSEQALTDAENARKDAETARNDAFNSNTIANSAKQDALNAQSNANNAINTSKDALANANSAVEESKKSTEAANSAKQDALNAQNNANYALINANSAMSDAKKALEDFDNLKIGGRNFIPKSDLVTDESRNSFKVDGLQIVALSTYTKIKKTSGTGRGFFSKSIDISKFQFEKFMTLSIKIDKINIMNADSNMFIRVFNKNSTGPTYKDICSAIFNVVKEPWETLSATSSLIFSDGFEIDTTKNAQLTIALGHVGDEINVKHWQLEVGNKATDWRPNPEDVQVEITNINNELSTKISQTLYNELKGTVDKQSTQIVQNKESITFKADKTIIDSLQATIDKQGTQITQNKDNITLKADKSIVDTLQGTVNSQGTLIKQNVTSIEQKASKTDVDTLSGKVKQVESTLTVQAGTITTLNTKADGNTTQIGKLQTSYDGLSSTVGVVKADFDGLKIGSANYILHSGCMDELSFNSFTYDQMARQFVENGIKFQKLTDNSSRSFITKSMPVYSTNFLPGDDIILSMEFKNEKLIATNSHFFIRWFLLDGTYTDTPVIDLNSIGTSSLYRQIYGKGIVPENVDYSKNISITIAISNSGNSGYFRKMQLEKGTKVSDWKPSFSDYTSSGEFSTFEQTVKGFQATVQSDVTGLKSQQKQQAGEISSIVTNINSIDGTIKDQQTQINQTKDSISLKADKTDLDTLRGTVNKQGTQISQNTNDISLKASKADVDTLSGQVSQTESTLSTQAGTITTLNTKTESNSTQIGKLQSSYDGLTSTIGTVKTDVDNIKIGSANYIPLSSGVDRQSFDSFIYDQMAREFVENGIHFQKLTDNSSRSFITKSMPVYSTAFSPDDDIVLSMEFKNEKAIAVNSHFFIRWFLLDGTFTDTTVIDLNAIGTSSVYKQIYSKGKVPQNVDYSKPINIKIAISNSGNSGYFRKMQLEKGTKVSDWKPSFSDYTTSSEFSTFEQTVKGFQTTVNSDISGLNSQQTQMADQISSTISRIDKTDKTVSNQSTQLTQLSDQWNVTSSKVSTIDGKVDKQASQITVLTDNISLKVDKGNAIAQINLSKENIRLEAKFIRLSGTSLIDDAVIKTSMIDDAAITSAKIQDASITSAKILNLDVNKISGNTTNFVQSSWNGVNNGITVTSEGLIARRSNGDISTKYLSDGLQIWGDGKWRGSLSFANQADTVLWNKRGGKLVLGFQGDNDADKAFYPSLKINGETGHIEIFSEIITNGSATQRIKFDTVKYNNISYPAIKEQGNQSGVFFGGSYMYLLDRGYVFAVKDIVDVTNKLKGQTVYLPLSMNSNGTAATWGKFAF